MIRRNFLKKAGILASSTTLLGTSEMIQATEKQPSLSDNMVHAEVNKDDLDAKLEKPLTAIIIGSGGRGNTYAQYAARFPKSLKIIGVSDINEYRRHKMGDRFNVKQENRFGDWSEVFKGAKIADIVMICTPDALHYGPCMKALELGYHVLLEKPAATSEADCKAILAQSKKYNRLVAVCHVLRYAPYFKEIKEIIHSGKIGDLVSIQYLEPIENIHMSHSYVRGNWHNSKETTPIIISKSCHDLDIIRWWVGKPCKKVTAFGDVAYFNASNAPKGSSKRCLDCKLERECTYSAKRIYYDKRVWLHVFDLQGTHEQQGEQILSKLRTTDYGKCVFQCDNDQCDHYVMNMEFEDGVTVSFAMEGHTSYGGRRTRLMGTKGDVVGDMNSFVHTDFFSGKQTKWSQQTDGHGGGDLRLVRDLLWAISRRDESLLTSTIEASIESHVMGFKAETARLNSTVENL